MKSLNHNLIKIAELLSDGKYHDGTSIGKTLHITRAAVWKAIKKLEDYAIPLRSVKGKGYCLTAPLLLLEADKIKANLQHSYVQLDILEKTDSTNNYLKQFLPNSKGTHICIAETQTNGKGRLSRQWYSPFGENIYLSMLYSFEKDISEISGLSLVVGLAVCQAIESMGTLSHPLQVKWPNDILLRQGKLAGVLIEMQAETNGSCQAIIGIGVNVNMSQALAKDIGQSWSSLLTSTTQYYDRNQLCAVLIDKLIDYLEVFSKGGILPFKEEWEKRDSLIGYAIEIAMGKKTYKGIGKGINDQGHLLVETEDKKIQVCASGDAVLLK